jgi:hypothetical protein
MLSRARAAASPLTSASRASSSASKVRLGKGLGTRRPSLCSMHWSSHTVAGRPAPPRTEPRPALDLDFAGAAESRRSGGGEAESREGEEGGGGE